MRYNNYNSSKEMATHSSTLAWKIPWMEEPGGLKSMGSLRVGNDWEASFHFSLSCIGEGNGNPLQCSCLENPRDGGAWWAAVYEVTQSRTWLKRLSSSSSSSGKEPAYQCRRFKRCRFDPWVWKEGMATHSSILAWRIPMDKGAWQAIQCIGLHRVGHDWNELVHTNRLKKKIRWKISHYKEQ